jgi:hypothetical protein
VSASRARVSASSPPWSAATATACNATVRRSFAPAEGQRLVVPVAALHAAALGPVEGTRPTARALRGAGARAAAASSRGGQTSETRQRGRAERPEKRGPDDEKSDAVAVHAQPREGGVRSRARAPGARPAEVRRG